MVTTPATDTRRLPIPEIVLLIGLQLLALLACAITIALATGSGFTPAEPTTAPTATTGGGP